MSQKTKNNTEASPRWRNSWWLDYLEGEFDPATSAEMKAILGLSKRDREIVTILSETKKMIQDSEETLPAISNDSLDKLHDKIMNQVEATEMKKTAGLGVRSLHRRLMTIGTSTTLSVLTLMVSLERFKLPEQQLKNYVKNYLKS